jgi:signal transduction histidine kinase
MRAIGNVTDKDKLDRERNFACMRFAVLLQFKDCFARALMANTALSFRTLFPTYIFVSICIVVDHYETVRRHKDGHQIDVSLSISPIRDKTGKIIGASKIARDIGERKRIEAEREEMLLKESAARAEAEAANRSKDEFLAVVSHELRSPLNAILGYNRMLRERLQDDTPVKQSCDIIERNARTQLQLVEDLLDTARIASGKLKLNLRNLDIVPVLADALDIVRLEAETSGVQLRIAGCGLRIGSRHAQSGHDSYSPSALLSQSGYSTTEGSQSAIVLGDAARLQQIVWNLLSITPAGGTVELRAELDEDHIRVIVSDTGKGIQPEFLPYIFDRFRQSDSPSSQRSGGLGLGLALVRHLAELHGGKVEATSEGAGRGAAFTFTMPLATQSPDAGARRGPRRRGLKSDSGNRVDGAHWRERTIARLERGIQSSRRQAGRSRRIDARDRQHHEHPARRKAAPLIGKIPRASGTMFKLSHLRAILFRCSTFDNRPGMRSGYGLIELPQAVP